MSDAGQHIKNHFMGIAGIVKIVRKESFRRDVTDAKISR